MPVLRLEHAISDFDVWKAAFDRDPARREQSGVPAIGCTGRWTTQYVAVDLEFDTSAEAERFQVALGRLWQSKQAAPALVGTPTVRIVEAVETTVY